jgi:hypothetical protein
MFCPQCGSEYREGFTVCADCDVALVDQPPADEDAGRPDERLVTVLEAGDPGLLAMAHSLLDGEGIPASFPGEGLQSLFGAGSIGGFNVAIGPVGIQVPEEYAERARELLAELEHGDTLPEEDFPADFPDDESPPDEPP